MKGRLAIATDDPSLADEALGDKYTVGNLSTAPWADLILSTKARYFEPEWFADPKLVAQAVAQMKGRARKGKG